MCKQEKTLLNTFYTINSETKTIYPSTTNQFVKMLSKPEWENQPYNLNNLWQLYSDHAPYGPLNGGIKIIVELNKIKSIQNLGLFEYIDNSEPMHNKAYFTDLKGNLIMEFPSSVLDSKFVKITETGRQFAHQLSELNNALTEIIDTCKKNNLDWENQIQMFRIKAVEIFGEDFTRSHQSQD